MILADQLKVLLSDLVTLSFRLQGAHWNVVGPDFAQYHELFGEIYADVAGSIDPVAENVRKLGEFTPYRLVEFARLRTLEDADPAPTPAELTADLLAANRGVLVTLKASMKAAEAEDRQGVMDFLAGRIDVHEKWDWFLRASVGKR